MKKVSVRLIRTQLREGRITPPTNYLKICLKQIKFLTPASHEATGLNKLSRGLKHEDSSP